ncbi:MAG TPA: ABC transporter substrate-binding protein, partial [Enterovirga sp.]
MQISRRTLIQGATALAGSGLVGARAQGQTIKIGVLSDFSGIYIDLLGPGGVACVQQAVADFAPEKHGFNVEVVFADHQNKPDVGASVARRWYEAEGVDMVIGLPNSSVALALAFVTKEKNKACIGTAVTSMDFTGAQCTPNTINWTYDAYMLAKATGTETVRAGGKTVGNSKYPIGATDYSSFLLAAQASGADVLGLALGGSDMVNCL